ncbi:MAG: MBL fold metallo-hydrolase [Gemmatimonadaceae bacterium]|nr:MBL fold metallo-hydrolase [Gemmatimonadaceae bacterium]
MTQSPQWHDGRFHNPGPMWNDMGGAISRLLDPPPATVPDSAGVPVVHPTRSSLLAVPASGLRVTWFGHSSSLIEIDGVRLLTDPIWSTRPSPVTWAGPQRWFPPVIALDSLPPIDAVLISHDHYDHLDRATIQAMRGWTTMFIVPLGIGAHLESWGIPPARIVELDWWQPVRVGALEIVATPARHASGRLSPQSDQTLWAGYAILGPAHRAFYSGDTGLHETLGEIGTRYGPFDVALIESGQYDAAWPDWHLGPEQAVEASRRVRAKAMIPVHWALFKLASHGWTEPAERVLAAGRCLGVAIITPRPGASVEPASLAGDDAERWWPTLPWSTASQAPVIATRRGDPADRVPPAPCVR